MKEFLFVLFIAFALTFFNEDEVDVYTQPTGFVSNFPANTVSILFTGPINNNSIYLQKINEKYNITGAWLVTLDDLGNDIPLLKSIVHKNVLIPYFQESSMGIQREYSEISLFFKYYNRSISVGFYGQESSRRFLQTVCNLSSIDYYMPTGDLNHTPTSLNIDVWKYMYDNNLRGVVAINQTDLAVKYYEEFLHDLARFHISVANLLHVEYK